MTITINSKFLKFLLPILAALGLVIFAVSCSSEAMKKGGETAQKEQNAVQTGFNRLSDSQQVKTYDWSQERQTVLDVEEVRATGATSTTAGYLEGVGLVWWCPSVGSPVPSTYQLSGTKQWVDLPGDSDNSLHEVDQGEPTGVYIGDSSGTWTMCLDDNGKKFAKYWEGYVDSTIGVVNSYPQDKRVRVDQATFQFKDKPK